MTNLHTILKMDSSAAKKPRLNREPQNNLLRDSDSALCEETDELMDVCVDEEKSNVQTGEKSGVDSLPSCSGVQKLQKPRAKQEIPEKVANELFNRFWMVTGRKKVDLSSENAIPSEFHLYGILNEIKKRSPSLKNLTDSNLDNIRPIDCKVTLIKVLTELGLEYDIKNLKALPKKEKAIVAFDIKSTPALAFCGIGEDENIAVNKAAKKGLAYFVAISQ